MEFLQKIRSRAERRRLGTYGGWKHAGLGGQGLFSQDDLSVANAAGSTVRADINSQLQALGSRMSGTSAPSTTYAHMLWVDTTNGVVKRRNAANSGWIVVETIDETFVLSRSSNTILDISDIGKTIIATSTFTQTLDAVATLGDGWYVDYRNDGTGVITLDPNSTEQINGATTLKIYPGEACRIACNGSAFKALFLSSGPVLISTGTASSSSSLDFTGLTGFSSYEFALSAVIPATDSVALRVRFSQDDGSTFKSGASDYAYITREHDTSDTAATYNSAGTTQSVVAGVVKNTAGWGVSGVLRTNDLASSSIQKALFGVLGHLNGSSLDTVGMHSSHYIADTAAVNAVRFLFSSGNIASGTIKCYGYRG